MRPMSSVISCSATAMKSNLPATARLVGSNVYGWLSAKPIEPSSELSLGLTPPRLSALASARGDHHRLVVTKTGSLGGRLATALLSFTVVRDVRKALVNWA